MAEHGRRGHNCRLTHFTEMHAFYTLLSHPAASQSPFSISCTRNSFHWVFSTFLKSPNHTLFAITNCFIKNVDAAVNLAMTRLHRLPVPRWLISAERSCPWAGLTFTLSFLVSLPHLLRDQSPLFCYLVSQHPWSFHLKRLLPFHLQTGPSSFLSSLHHDASPLSFVTKFPENVFQILIYSLSKPLHYPFIATILLKGLSKLPNSNFSQSWFSLILL